MGTVYELIFVFFFGTFGFGIFTSCRSHVGRDIANQGWGVLGARGA
jgi:hypothetical protein